MADSPTKLGEGVVEVEILSDGSVIPETMQVRSLTVHRAFNKIPVAVIVIEDGDMPKQSFDHSDKDTFAPGAKITIRGSYKQNKQQIFVGVVVKHGIKISSENDTRLVIECKSEVLKLALSPHNVNYQNQKDSDIIVNLLGATSLRAKVDTTSTSYSELVQYNCTDWDFVMMRAEANAFLVNVQDDSIVVGKPVTSLSPVLTVEYGADLYDFSADIDAQSQVASVSSVAWDVKKQSVATGAGTFNSLSEQGNLDQKTLATAIGASAYRLQSDTILEPSALSDWASGQMLRSGLARVRGKMTIQGSATATVGSIIELKGVGERFSGKVYVSSIVHRIANGNWLTEVEFGLRAEMFSQAYSVKAPAASGLCAPAEGLHIGIVKRTDEDSSGEFRVQVSLPVLQAENDEIWARMAGFYSSSGVGAYFMPEIGDEVIVGYFNNDPSSPVVLGSMYSSKHSPPYKPDAENTKKAILSKQKILIEFDDDKKSLTLATPANNRIILDEESKSITLTDQNNNKVVLDDAGISLSGSKDISISAAGKVIIKAGSSLEMTASTDFKATGMNATVSASQALKTSGQVSAEISASGNTVVKGAMVMIN